nr:SMP-30/gluconolactonase/LRE family protein [Agrobacterium sp. a22-2]
MTTDVYDLAESLFWDPAAQRLVWIDAWRSCCFSLDTLTNDLARTDYASAIHGRPIGSVAKHGRGGLVSGIRGGFYHLGPENTQAKLLCEAEQDRPATNRLNDGKCDRAGRFWCASVNTDHKTPSGALWRLTEREVPQLMRDELIAGNGIAWSPDDAFLYLADTFVGKVWRYDFDLSSGEIDNEREFISLSRDEGGIDGATVDSNGCYWAALFRGGAVGQFDPDGKLMRRIELPVSDPTICAFGGPDLDVLFVASATRFLDESQRRSQPLAGTILAIHGANARGLPEPCFGVV